VRLSAGKIGPRIKNKNKNTMVNNKKKWTMMNPIRG
jgi:hypothetical protein